MIRTSGLAAASVAAIAAFASPGAAATYNVMFGGNPGTFDAPLGGGALTSFSATLGGTLFDTLALGAAAPVYTPILNTLNNTMDVEFHGAGQPDGEVTNSTPSAPCPLGQCVLLLYNTSGGTALPEYLVLNTVTLTNVTLGLYSIDPTPVPAGPVVPLPASAWLFAGALSLLGGLGWRRRAAKA
ncbi:MAG: hypothetical protein R3E44_04335 [Paracoccaceae bacterium]